MQVKIICVKEDDRISGPRAVDLPVFVVYPVLRDKSLEYRLRKNTIVSKDVQRAMHGFAREFPTTDTFHTHAV